MSDAVSFLLDHGSYAALFAALLATGVGVPVSEDLVLLAAGALSHRNSASLGLTLAVALAGIFSRDLFLFLGARRLGPAAFERRPFALLLPPGRRERLRNLFARRGGGIVFLARHAPGLRAPVFAMAGILGMPLPRFLVWDALGLAITGPLVFALGYLLSDRLDLVRRDLVRVEQGAFLVAILLAIAIGAVVARSRGARATAGMRAPIEPGASPPDPPAPVRPDTL